MPQQPQTEKQRTERQTSAQPSGTTTEQEGRSQKEEGTLARSPTRLGFLDRPGLLSMSPFGLMRRFMEEMDPMFGGLGLSRGIEPRGLGGGLWMPELEVSVHDNLLRVRADLPGIKADDIRIDLTDEGLILEGERTEEREEERRGVYQSEVRYGSFRRVLPLPDNVDPETISAKLDNGVLEIQLQLPEQPSSKKRRIPIEQGKSTEQQVEPVH
jgi:HSP20 family protein